MRSAKFGDAERAQITLRLLDSVERGEFHSQRRLASDLGVALGLVNAYIKRCINKGLIKMRDAPAHRYAYYLTPRGFAEKSRLTVEYMSYSLSLFRHAKRDCQLAFANARSRGWTQFAILGTSELSDIAAICALECKISIVAVIDPESDASHYIGAPCVASVDDVPAGTQALLITDVNASNDVVASAVAKFGQERVFTLDLISRDTTEDDDGPK